MKRFVIVLLAIAMATFAFAEGSCFKAYVNGGVNEPGMIGTGVFGYTHNTVKTGFDVKLGFRKHLKDYFEMPAALPLELQLGLGFQMNPAKGSSAEDLTAVILNVDFLYPIDQVVCVPIVDISPFLGLQYDFQMYRAGNGGETWNSSVVGLNVGVMFDVDLSERLALELVLSNPFNYGFSPKYQIITSQANANLGLSYVFGGNK